MAGEAGASDRLLTGEGLWMAAGVGLRTTSEAARTDEGTASWDTAAGAGAAKTCAVGIA